MPPALTAAKGRGRVPLGRRGQRGQHRLGGVSGDDDHGGGGLGAFVLRGGLGQFVAVALVEVRLLHDDTVVVGAGGGAVHRDQWNV